MNASDIEGIVQKFTDSIKDKNFDIVNSEILDSATTGEKTLHITVRLHDHKAKPAHHAPAPHPHKTEKDKA